MTESEATRKNRAILERLNSGTPDCHLIHIYAVDPLAAERFMNDGAQKKRPAPEKIADALCAIAIIFATLYFSAHVLVAWLRGAFEVTR